MIPVARTEREILESFVRNDVHDFIATQTAYYTLMFDPLTGKWIAWVSRDNDSIDIEYSEFDRDEDARARLKDIYTQLEKVPLQ